MKANDLINILKHYPDYEVKVSLEQKIPDEDLKDSPYPYPIACTDLHLSLNDIGHSDKVFLFGATPESEQNTDPKPKKTSRPPLIHKGDNRVYNGQWLHVYERHFQTKDGKTKVYEMVSRNSNVDTISPKEIIPQAVCMAIHKYEGMHVSSKDCNEILLLKEFRLSVNNWVYNFPCGLIEAGEDTKEACTRELQEETGLHLHHVECEMPPAYSSEGLTDEAVSFIVGMTSSDELKRSNSPFEYIEPMWCTKSQVRELLKTETFAGRTQIYCHLWANS